MYEINESFPYKRTFASKFSSENSEDSTETASKKKLEFSFLLNSAFSFTDTISRISILRAIKVVSSDYMLCDV